MYELFSGVIVESFIAKLVLLVNNADIFKQALCKCWKQ